MPYFMPRGKSNSFSRVASGTWGIFSSYGRDGHSKLVFAYRHQDSCLVTSDSSGISTSWQGNTDTSRGEAGDPVSLSSWHRYIWIPINFQEESGIITFGSIEHRVPLEVSKGCEASCPDEARI